jgi:hypothetical protein
MSEAEHIARGTDATLIVAGILIMLAAGAWYRWGTGHYTPAAVGLAILGVACIVTGAAIIVVARVGTHLRRL